MSPKRRKKSTKKSIQEKKDNTRVQLDNELWQNLRDQLEQRYKSETQLNIAYIEGDWYKLVESGKIRKEPPTQQTLQNFLKEGPKQRAYWFIDGLCQLLLGCSFEDWQNSRSPRSDNQPNQSQHQKNVTEQDRADWEPAEATEADATPAANPENSITSTTPNTPIMGRLSVVPKIPENLLHRDEEIAAVKQLLLSDPKQPVAIAGQSRQVGIQGMGGIGKSTLAAIVAHDQEVRRRFPDGIFWQPLGQNPSLKLRQLDLCKTLGDPAPQFEDVQGGKVHLRELLKNKTCLLILDDVWHVDDADAFNVLSSSSQLLLTTRNLELIHGLNAQEFQLSILTDTQAQAMLASYADQHLENLPTITHEIARECGNLPLALAMIGAQMRGKPENRWDNLLNKLRKADLEKIRFEFADYPYPDLFKAIQVSVEELEAEEQKRYLDFAVFPEDTPIPEAVLQTFWQLEGLDQYDTQDMVDRLVNLSLAQRVNQECLTLHDLQYDYVRKQAGDLSVLHQRLLNAYAAKCEDGWHTGPNDGYFFDNLANHLLAAGKKSELRQLLLNFQWLEAKLNATDVNALIADYELLSDDPDLRLIKEAIQLSAHILIDEKNQLASQLLGRLLSFDSSPIKEFIKKVKPSSGIPWLRPLTGSLIPPGGPLLRTLIGHKNEVSAIAITPDGQQIVSGSSDRGIRITPDGQQIFSGSWDTTIKIWDFSTGKQLKTIKDCNHIISILAITPDGKHIVSISDDNTIKIYDLSTGKIVVTLTDHQKCINKSVIADNAPKLFFTSIYSIDSSGTIKFLDFQICKSFWTIKKSSSKLITVPDNIYILFTSKHNIKILEFQTGKYIQTVTGHYSDIWDIAITLDRNYIVFTSKEYIKILDLKTGKEIRTMAGHKNVVNAVAITPDDKQIISGSWDMTLKVWDLKTGKEIRTITHNNRSISTIAITPDGKSVVTGSSDMTIQIWDLQTSENSTKIPSHNSEISTVLVTADGQHAISASEDQNIKVWELQNIEQKHSIWDKNLILKISMLSAENFAIATTEDGEEKITVFDIKKGRVIDTSKLDNYVDLLDINLTGLVVSSLWNECYEKIVGLEIWNLYNKDKICTIPIDSLRSVQMSSNEKRAILVSKTGNVSIWDLCNGKKLWILEDEQLSSIPDDEEDDLDFIEKDADLNLYLDSTDVVSISDRGNLAGASLVDESSIKIWDLKTGKIIQKIGIYNEYEEFIDRIEFSCDNQILGVLGYGALPYGYLTLWHINNRQMITGFYTEGRASCFAIAPDNRTIIVGEESGRLHFLRLEGL